MNFYFITPLQHMAAAKIAQCIYYDKEIEKMIPLAKNGAFWKLIEEKTAEKLPSLPDLLKTRVSKFIRPIHSERIRWFRDHQIKEKVCDPMDCDPAFAYKNSLCWKNDGSVDRTQTAKKFVQNKNFDPELRFVMACTYFLEDAVLAGCYRDKLRRISRNKRNAAVRFWMERLSRRSSRKISWKDEIDRYFKNLSVRDSDIPLRITCFFPYLSWEGKKKYLPYLMLFKGHVDDLVSCLRTMDEEERMETFSVYRTNILLCFLIWPFQYLFIDLAKQLWNHMNFDLFDNIVKTIVMNANSDSSEDFDYAELLKEFWRLGPASYKEKIEKNKKLFKMIEKTLKCDGKSSSPFLSEAPQESWNEQMN